MTICFVVVMLCLPLISVAQPGAYRFDHLSLEQGLSQSNIQYILQDHLGFIWFSTQDGLNKYDGYTFTVYSHDPYSQTSMAGNALKQLYEDHNGNIWILLGIGGINKFDRATETFTYYSHDPRNDNSLSDNNVTSILEDKLGRIWIGTPSGLNSLDPTTGKFIHFQFLDKKSGGSGDNFITTMLQDSSGNLWFGTHNGVKKLETSDDHLSRYVIGLTNTNVTTLLDDHNGSLWIGTEGGLNKLDTKSGKITRYTHYDNEPNSITGDFITGLSVEHDTILWVGTTNGLTKLNTQTSACTRYQHIATNPLSISQNHILSLLLDSYGTLWVTTVDGHLNVFDKHTGRFQQLKNNPLNPMSISHNNVSFLMEDKSRTIWVGTQGGGINKFSRIKQKFSSYQNDPTSNLSLSNNAISAIAEGKNGILWVGTTDNGLGKYDQRGNKTYFKHDPKNKNSLIGNSVTSIYLDNDGVLWVGTRNGLDALDDETMSFKHYRYSPQNSSSISSDIINCIIEDHLGFIWVGTDSGLNRYEKNTKTFTQYHPDSLNPHSLSSRFVWSLYEDREGNLWVGTAVGGLNKFNPQSNSFDRFEYNPETPNGINNRTVDVIYEPLPSNGNNSDLLWIGTYSGGLNLFDKSKQTFTFFTEKDGLSNNRINGILEDSSGNLWLSTNKGISKFDPITKRCRRYDFTDGLQSNEFIRGAFCKTSTGEMFFGGINGMNSFYPDAIQDNRYVPPVVLTNFMKFDKRMKFPNDVSSLKEITLSYEDNFFSIEFAALDYSSPSKNQYSYMMEGFDNDWILSGTRRFASYTNLDPGAYVFHYKGSNNDGVWNDAGGSIIIHITPPFYKTKLFRSAAILFILLVVYLTYRYRVRNIQAQKKKLEILVTERTHELNAKTQELEKAHHELEQRVLDRTVELRTSNELLRKLKEFNENLIQTMAEGIMVYNDKGFVTYVNPAIAEQLAYPQEELIGKHWSQFIPSNMHQTINEADKRRMMGISDHYEIQLIRKDGIRNYFLVGGSPIFEDGKFAGTFTVFTNITERKHAEERIQDQAALIESARDAIVVCDIEGKIIYWNTSAEIIYGWKKDEASSKNLGKLLYQETSPEHLEALRSVLEKGEWAGELHQTRNDSKIVIVDSRWTLLHDQEGFPKSILMINTDITERVKLQMQFLRTQRLESLGTLASGIAHDLNNVLAPILLAVQIIKNKTTDEGSKKLLVTLEGSAKRASGIVRQVLTFARGAEGKKENLQPKHFVKELQSIIDETFPKSIELKTNIGPDLWTVCADPTQLHQVLLNLCVNARDAMPDGGTLTIGVENALLDEVSAQFNPQAKAGAYVVFSVEDTGTGMSKEVIEKIFEPFFTTKGIGKGTGLGLSTVIGIVKSHDGFINLYSEPGKGSTFKVYLPAGSVAQEEKLSLLTNLPSGNGETILVVDDEMAIRQITKGTLETYGYKIYTANNGVEAEELYRIHAKEIKLVITDMMMPLRGGAETITILKELNPKLKFIITSGLVSHEHATAELGKHVSAFLPKPYTADKLLRTISEVLNN